MHFSQLLELQTEQKLRFVIELLNHSNLAIAIKLEVVRRHLTCHAFLKRVLVTAHCVSLIGIYQKCHWVQWGRKGKIIGFTRKKKEKNERKWFFVVIKPEQHSLACVLKLLWPGVQKAARQGRRQMLMYFRGVIRTSCWPERRAFLSFQLLFLPARGWDPAGCSVLVGKERTTPWVSLQDNIKPPRFIKTDVKINYK